MRTTTARLDLNVKHLAAAVLLIAAAGSTYAANEPVDGGNQAVAASTQPAVKHQSKSQATRQQIMDKVARHEPLTYTETLYLR